MPKVPDITPEELAKIRVDRCKTKINQALKEENCSLDASMLINQGGVKPIIEIVPLKPAPKPPVNA